MLKSLIRKLLPESAVNAYHFALAHLAAAIYRYPSNKLFVIGVTGTNGKSTTTNFIGRILEHAGHKVGWTTTVNFKVGDREWVNDKKMTMLGRFQTQKLLRDMVRAGCAYAIIETSSQGIAQFRHVGINYDVAVFTNLTPEHIESHGGFENYKRAKGKLFSSLMHSGHKQEQEKAIVANIDDEYAGYFLSFDAEKRYGFGLEGATRSSSLVAGVVPVIAKNVQTSSSGSTFSIPTPYDLPPTPYRLQPIGRFNVYNALAAIATCRAVGIEWNVIADGVARLESVPGRLEVIEEGQTFLVVVDYAYEPAALAAVYDALGLIEKRRIIHVVGSAGGGRDVARRAVLGQMCAVHDAVVIVTNEDPYDEDPITIVNDVADAAAQAGKRDGVDLFRVLDRQEAIDMAMAMAEASDLVLITGKGCEPVMAVADGKKIPWDDRAAARKALHKRYAR